MKYLKFFESYGSARKLKFKKMKYCIGKNILNQLTWEPMWDALPHFNQFEDMRCVYYRGVDYTGDGYFENTVELIFGKFHQGLYFNLIISDVVDEIEEYEKEFKTFEEGLEFINNLGIEVEIMWFDVDTNELVDYEEWMEKNPWYKSDQLKKLNNKTGLFK